VRYAAFVASPIRRPGGRSARVRSDVVAATTDLLLEGGLEATTIVAIAERSGVHHTSIYRRWGDRSTLIREALLGAMDTAVPVRNTGDLHDELTHMLEDVVSLYQSPLGAVVLDLVRSQDPSLLDLQRSYLGVRLAHCAEVIDRAKRRKEVPEATDYRLVFELLMGPILSRALLSAEGVGALDASEIVRLVLDGVIDGRASRSQRRDSSDGPRHTGGRRTTHRQPGEVTAKPR
jgi:AcrR family transcriptional regulator